MRNAYGRGDRKGRGERVRRRKVVMKSDVVGVVRKKGREQVLFMDREEREERKV